MANPRLRIFAGPNGSGKSTLGKLKDEVEPIEIPNWFIDYVLKYY